MKIKYRVAGLDCPNCALKLGDMLEKSEGIDSAKVNFLTEKITVETSLNEEDAFETVKRVGARFSPKVVIEK